MSGRAFLDRIMASNEDATAEDENKGFFKKRTELTASDKCSVCDLVVSQCNCDIPERNFHVELDLSNGGSNGSSKSYFPVNIPVNNLHNAVCLRHSCRMLCNNYASSNPI